MKKLFILICLLFLADVSHAAAPNRLYTYTDGNVILSAENNANENALFSYLQSGVDTYLDGSIYNADLAAAANVQSDKLNLTSIAQAVGITAAGSLTNAGVLDQNGNASFTAITDLGTVTTGIMTGVDINSGGIDNTILGGISPQLVRGTRIQATTEFLAPSGVAINEFSVDGTLAGNSDTAVPTEKAVKTYVDGVIDFQLMSTTTGSSSSAVTSDVTIAASNVYLVTFFTKNTQTGGSNMSIRFNSDTGAGNYDWSYETALFNGTPTATRAGDDADAQIVIGPQFASTSAYIRGSFIIDTNKITGSHSAFVHSGSGIYSTDGSVGGELDFGGVFLADATVTSFELYNSGGTADFTYTIKVYKLGS